MQAVPTAIRVGDLIIGVRTNDPEMDALLAAALRPHVEAGVDAPPNLSLIFGEAEGRVRGLHFLYCSGASMVRTDSHGRLLRGALRHLEGFAPTPSAGMRVNAKLLVRNEDAVLVDARFGGTVDILERRLHRLGYRHVDVHAPVLDRETLEVRLEGARLELDAEGRAEIDRRFPPRPHEIELQDRRYRLRGLLAWGDPEPDGLSPAQRYAELTPLVTDRDGSIVADDLEVLARLARSRETVRMPYPDPGQLFTAVRDLDG